MNPTWTWATVVLAEPLRIRLDGETEPLNITPDSLIRPLGMGDRVWVQLYERRVLIIGSGNGLSSGGSLAQMPHYTSALMDQANSPLRIAWFGDSISEGWYTNSPTVERRAMGLVQDRLRHDPARSSYARGWTPAVYVNNALPAEGSSSESMNPGGNLAPDYSVGLGLKALSMKNSAWREWSFYGTSVKVWWWKHNVFAGNATVSIDGGAGVTITGGGGSEPELASQSFTGLGEGTHTVRVTAASGGGVFLLEAVETFHNDGPRSVRIYDGSHFGWTTLNFILPNVRWKQNLTALNPQMVVIALGTNDSIAYSASDYEDYLTTFMFHLLDAIGPDHNYAIVSMPERTDFPTISPWSEYVSAARRVANAFGRGIHIDLAPWWRDDLTADGVHPTADGQRIIAAAISKELGV